MKNIYKELTLLKVLVISFLFFSANIFAQASFSAKTDFAVGNFPYAVTTGDLNGDGMPDMVVTNSDDNTISILMNITVPGAAASSFSAKTDFSTGFNPYSVAIGDLNGDGKLDIAVANRFGGSVSVLLNTTPIGSLVPTFTDNLEFNANSFTISVSIADINGDGKKDLIATNFNSNNVSVFLNTTAPGAVIPTFSDKVDFPTSTSPISVSVNDLNGDGKPDLSVACYGNPFRVSILFNTTATGAATPTFSAKTDFLTGDNPSSISAGDLNGDGIPDLAIANYSTGNISILLNTTAPGAAAPSFSSKVDFLTGSNNATHPNHISMSDLNGDGKLDLAVANYGANNFTVFLNTTSPGASTPTFLPKTIYETGSYPFSVFIDDLNGDSKQDLVVVNSGSANISVFLNTTTMGAPTPVFLAHTDFTTGSAPVGEAIGDLNGDGKPDLVIANSGSNTFSVMLNTTAPGSVTPTYSAKTDFTTGNGPVSVSIGDLNGDGKLDLVVANSTSNTVSVFLNSTAPGASTPIFLAKTDFITGSAPTSISIGDVNGDGYPDIVVGNQNSDNISVILNTTTPGASVASFSSKTDFATGNIPKSVSLGDFNGDGNPDLVVVNDGSASVSILLNITAPGASTPTFSSKTDFTSGTHPYAVSVGDLNGDGKLDLAVANDGSGSVSVLLNTTAAGASVPTFSSKTDFTTGTNPWWVSICDLNGDGKLDLAVANYTPGNISVFLNTTTPGNSVPSFSSKTDFSTGTSPTFVSIRDMNGDGKPDLIVTNNGSNNISLLLNNMDLTLPVELTSFSSLVRERSVVLYWNTATELNSNKFVIERSIVNSKNAASTWVSIGIVPASGTTSSPKKYSYIDNNLQAGKYQYRLKMVDDNGTFKYSSIVEAAIGIPKDYSLSQNYPNPFNPSTKIEYTLPGTGFVQLQIFSVTGQLVKSIVNQNQEAGYYSIDFNGSNLSSGLYIYRLSVNNQNIVRKMMLLK